MIVAYTNFRDAIQHSQLRDETVVVEVDPRHVMDVFAAMLAEAHDDCDPHQTESYGYWEFWGADWRVRLHMPNETD